MPDPDETPEEKPADDLESEQSPDPQEGEEFDKDRAQAKITKANNEAKSLRKRLKDLEPQLEELARLKEEGKSDKDKLEERATGAEGRASKAEHEAARLRVALKKGLTEVQAKRLIGENEEELEADADELLASFKDEDEGPEPKRRPRERLRPGASPSSEPEETDPRKLAESIPRSY